MEPSDPATIYEVDLVTLIVTNMDLIVIAVAVLALVWFLDYLGKPAGPKGTR